MADLPPPETLRQPTGDVVNINSTSGLNTMSIGGKTYNILDGGYICGNISCTVLSEFTCLIHPPPYCNVCSTCWHWEGKSYLPDYETCGTTVGLYGILVKFKAGWICHCLKMLGYTSISMNKIQPVGTAPFCNAPPIDPPLHNFNPFPLAVGAVAVGGVVALGVVAAGAGAGGGGGGAGAGGGGGGAGAGGVATLIALSSVSSATLPSGETISFDFDGGGEPFRPGIDVDINALPNHPPGSITSINGECQDNEKKETSSNTDACDTPNTPQNAIILTIPKIV